MDCTEAYAWGQQFLLGYGRHPPVTGWIARIWYGVFPAANWSSYALSQVMISCSLISICLIGERALGRRRATLVVFVMMLYPIYIAANGPLRQYSGPVSHPAAYDLGVPGGV